MKTFDTNTMLFVSAKPENKLIKALTKLKDKKFKNVPMTFDYDGFVTYDDEKATEAQKTEIEAILNNL